MILCPGGLRAVLGQSGQIHLSRCALPIYDDGESEPISNVNRLGFVDLRIHRQPMSRGTHGKQKCECEAGYQRCSVHATNPE